MLDDEETGEGQEEVVDEGAVPEEGVEEHKDEEGAEGAEEHAEGEGEEASIKKERPAINYQKELERKNRELERVRAERETERSRQTHRYDPNDLSTWSDNDLKAISNTNDPQYLRFKDQAQDILIDRKVERARAKEVSNEKRLRSEMALRKDYPEALDASSEFAIRMEEKMYEFDLDKSPAGRLAAAKLVAAEMQGAKARKTATARKSEKDRVASVKGRFSSGDRVRTEKPASKEAQERMERVHKGDEQAFDEELKARLSRRK